MSFNPIRGIIAHTIPTYLVLYNHSSFRESQKKQSIATTNSQWWGKCKVEKFSSKVRDSAKKKPAHTFGFGRIGNFNSLLDVMFVAHVARANPDELLVVRATFWKELVHFRCGWLLHRGDSQTVAIGRFGPLHNRFVRLLLHHLRIFFMKFEGKLQKRIQG